MKIRAIHIVLTILILLIASCSWNSDAGIYIRGKSKYESILVPGVSKKEIISLLEAHDDNYYDHPKNTEGSLFNDNNCPYTGHSGFTIGCKYSGFTITSNPMGFFMEPYLYVYFVYDENNELAFYKMGIERTFL